MVGGVDKYREGKSRRRHENQRRRENLHQENFGEAGACQCGETALEVNFYVVAGKLEATAVFLELLKT